MRWRLLTARCHHSSYPPADDAGHSDLEDSSASNTQVLVARSTDGGSTFSPPVRVHRDDWEINGCSHAGPALAVDDDGAVHVAWYTAAHGGVGLYRAVSTDRGLTFHGTQVVEPDVPKGLARLVSAGGTVWLAWESPIEKEVHLGAIGDLPNAQTFPGTLPALSAAGSVLSLAWELDEKVDAYVLRQMTA